MTKIAICYATSSGILRWTLGHSDRDVTIQECNPRAGESVIICDHTLVTDQNGIFQESLAQTQVGITPQFTTCAVIDGSNNVTSIIRADPALDSPSAGHTLLPAPSGVRVGFSYDSTLKQFTLPGHTIPAGTVGKGGVVSATPVIVPTVVIPAIAVTSGTVV